MKAADALLENMAMGQPRAAQPQAGTGEPLAEPPPGWEVRCDVNGCSIVRVSKEASAPVCLTLLWAIATSSGHHASRASLSSSI